MDSSDKQARSKSALTLLNSNRKFTQDQIRRIIKFVLPEHKSLIKFSPQKGEKQ